MSDRPENRAHRALMKARATQDCEWPEPETTQFYGTLTRGAFGIIISVLGRKDTELAREIATSAVLNLASYRGESQFSTWFYRLARNRALNHIRGVERKHEVDLELGADLEAPHFALELRLPKEFSETDNQFLGLILNGYTLREISKVFGISKSQADRRWQALRKRLSEVFDGKHDSGSRP